MTQQDRIRVGEVWLGLAQMYGREVPRATLSLMINAVSDLPVDKIMTAFNDWARSSKHNRHPLPVDIRQIVCPEENISAEDQAREIAARICGAVPKFGWCNGQAARAYVGEQGWAVIERNGGWRYLCEHLGLTIQPTTFQAQVRDQLSANLRYGEGVLEAKVLSLDARRGGESISIGQILKLEKPTDEGA